MRYIEGFVAAVPKEKREAYRAHAARAAAMMREFGATRVVEAWGDEVPDGKVTDVNRAVQAKSDEVVVFSWIEYPNKAVRDEAQKRFMSDPRMQELSPMPFDGQRMIYGGFQTILDEA